MKEVWSMVMSKEVAIIALMVFIGLWIRLSIVFIMDNCIYESQKEVSKNAKVQKEDNPSNGL